jgi:hypothetical protein
MSGPSPSWETTNGWTPLEIVRNSIAAVYAPAPRSSVGAPLAADHGEQLRRQSIAQP